MVDPDPAQIKPIKSVYSAKLSQLTPGMTLPDFRSVIPDAFPAGQFGSTIAYEVTLKQVIYDKRRPGDAMLGFYEPKNIVDQQELWFYFRDGRLLTWGDRDQWPGP